MHKILYTDLQCLFTDQSIFLKSVGGHQIHINVSSYYVLILLGEIRCRSLLGLKQLKVSTVSPWQEKSKYFESPFKYPISLHSKRFQSSYCAKVRAGAKKKGGRGRERGEEETLARKPHDSEKRPLIFHGSVDL